MLKRNLILKKRNGNTGWFGFGGGIVSIIKRNEVTLPFQNKGPVVQLNRISDFGSEGYRFESCRGHKT